MVKDNKILISEIFKSIDGEGFHAGQATVFVRTFGCNLKCIWCDTKSTWTEEQHIKVYGHGPTWMTVDEIIEQVEKLEEGWPNKSICLTGGEPLMEDNKELITELIDRLVYRLEYAVNVETNGAIDYNYWINMYPVTQTTDMYGNRRGMSLVTDWKLPSSKMNHFMIESNLGILRNCDLIKCVITDDPEDWAEFERICKSGTKAKIYLSPCFGQVTLNKIPEFIIAHPEYNIVAQIQLHKHFWEPTKIGV
jgi:7-carboxy-7-deazaguanine synthase